MVSGITAIRGLTMKHAPREHQRVYLTFYLRVFEEDNFIGFLIDISQDGMMLMSENILQEGKYYQLKMKIPSSLDWKSKDDQDRYVNFTAQCKWSRHDEVDKEFYLSGFEFTELHEDDNSLIRSIIEEYRIR